jgi:PBSX family phage terminase large subunit
MYNASKLYKRILPEGQTMALEWSDKQKEFWHNSSHRWNVKAGATRSGKTYLDYYMIPKRIRELHGKDGLVVILGATKGTLQRNIIEPLQGIWGEKLVSDIKSDNTAFMFGEKVHCIGAEKITAMNKIRGSFWKYLYGDELATWNQEVFTMAKSRLDRAYSKADLTLNPEGPTHWAKKFIDSDIDIFCQNYKIDDNPFLDPVFVDNLKREYAGTIYYNRYILGQWVRAEGSCYQAWDRERHVVTEPPGKISFCILGADIGGTGSATSFTNVGFFVKDNRLCAIVLDELFDDKNYSVEAVLKNWKDFVERSESIYPVLEARSDSAEQLIRKSMSNVIGRPGWVKNSLKKRVNDRIRMVELLMNTNRFYVMKHCKHTIEALESAVWMEGKEPPERLDDGSYSVDPLDSMEYALEVRMRDFGF